MREQKNEKTKVIVWITGEIIVLTSNTKSLSLKMMFNEMDIS